MDFIDLRSDTVTWPIPSMKAAMMAAQLGDDGYREDLTVIQLEELAAETLGKEAAVYVPSGTFGNQLAIFTHCSRGQEVILPDDCHIVQNETAAASVISQVQLRTLPTVKGALDPNEVEQKIRKDLGDPHCPTTGLICVENAFSNGCVIDLKNFEELRKVADNYKIPIHLDGARIFNAATTLGVPAKEIAKYVDSVMFCLSKGLCAPVGSLLVGTKEFIAKARKNRKLLGGSMRQAGIVAAAGIVGIKEVVPRLAEDHVLAKKLAEGLNGLRGVVKVIMENVQINMVFFTIESEKVKSQELVEYFLKSGIKISGAIDEPYRFVVHYYIKEEHVNKIIETFKNFLEITL